MTEGLLIHLLPLVTLGVLSILFVVLTAFLKNRVQAGGMALAILVLSLAAISYTVPGRVGPLFVVDFYVTFFLSLVLVCSLVVTLLLLVAPGKETSAHPEIFPLLLLSTLGAGVIVASSHFITFFLGLETLSVSVYALIAFQRTPKALEAAIKYLILASVASSFLLFGIALIYSQTGTLDLETLSALGAAHNLGGLTLYLAVGTAMVLIGIAFKIAIVPFHMWAPDIYEGAQPPIAGFIATASKGAVFAFFLRYLSVATNHDYAVLSLVISIVAIVSMFVGNLLALLQTNLKRLIAYSSIAHAGYVLVALEASGPMALQAVAYYLAVYFAAVLGVFGVISILSTSGDGGADLSAYEGLASKNPFLAGVMTLMLFSLAGIPLTAGFIGEFYILSAGVGSRLWTLVLALVFSSVIGLFYYLRVILALYRPPSESIHAGTPTNYLGSAVLSVLSLFILALGVFPSPFMALLSPLLSFWR